MKTYFKITETQVHPDGTVADIVTNKDNRREAESVFHMAAGSVALSTLPMHIVLLQTLEGDVLDKYKVTNTVNPVDDQADSTDEVEEGDE